MYASTSVASGIKSATNAMVAMNKEMEPDVIKEFQKNSAQLDTMIQMMSEAIDVTLDKDYSENKIEDLTNQVLDEIGVGLTSQSSVMSSDPDKLMSKADNMKKLTVHRWSAYWRGIFKNILYIFKKKKTPKDALRTSKRELAAATQDIERELASLELEEKDNHLEEKRLLQEIKATARTGNEAATKILARQLVRVRQKITYLQGSLAQIRVVTTHTQAMYASTSVASVIKSATNAMVAMNKEMEPDVIKEFQKNSAQLDTMIQMMSEAIDVTLDKGYSEDKIEDLTTQQ